MKKHYKTLACSLAVVLLAGCDIVEKDQLPVTTQQIDMFVAPNKSGVIDVAKIIPDVTLLKSKTGSANYVNNRYVTYNLKGTSADRFSFEAESPTARTLTDVTINPFSNQTTCEESGSFTYARIKANSALVVNLFNNAEFCGFDPSNSAGLAISHGMPGDIDENTDGLNLSICSCNGSSAIATYVPPAGFVGQVKFTYRLGVFFGGHPDIMNPSQFAYYSKQDAIIDVVE